MIISFLALGFIWLAFSFVAGAASYFRGRGFIVMFLVSLVISPFVTIILIFSAMDLVKEEEDERRHKEILAMIQSTSSEGKIKK